MSRPFVSVLVPVAAVPDFPAFVVDHVRICSICGREKTCGEGEGRSCEWLYIMYGVTTLATYSLQRHRAARNSAWRDRPPASRSGTTNPKVYYTR